MNHRRASLASFAAVLLLAAPAAAQVYTWVDEQGTTHFTEEPPPKSARARKIPLERVAPPPERTPPQPVRPAEAPAERAASAKRSEPPPAPRRSPPAVLLYTTAWCPWCQKAREWFAGQGVPFTERDIEKDPQALERRLRIDGTKNVPMAVIGDRTIRGYAPAKYRAALDAR